MKKITLLIMSALLAGTMSTVAMAEPGSGASHTANGQAHGGSNADFRHNGGHYRGGGNRGGYNRHYGHGRYYGGGYDAPFYGYDDDDEGFYGNPAAGIIGGIIGGAIGGRF